MISHVLSILVDNNPGVLTRVCSLFNRRGFNIDTVSSGHTEDEKLTRITLLTKVRDDDDDEGINQIINQIKKLEDVHKVEEFDNENSICKQMLFIKVKAEGNDRREIINIGKAFKVSIIDITPINLIIQIIGDNSKLCAFENLIESFGILEIVGSGFIAMKKDADAII
ncbi:acetolactate synthase small subunit [Clostridium estertheticum]|uniref:acetolactate synthase small subunit n=1 Tax=Clostridium estertheticum TaxID=238834 RepID=UPI0013EED4AD|nr:acetolactate synthase small subunit [Clostridium estertheticum]MBZ9608810.1 acetolactate synthase small subunit [Clostridium estertheticum]